MDPGSKMLELRRLYTSGAISKITFKKEMKRLAMSKMAYHPGYISGAPEKTCSLAQPVQLQMSLNGISFPCDVHSDGHYVVVC